MKLSSKNPLYQLSRDCSSTSTLVTCLWLINERRYQFVLLLPIHAFYVLTYHFSHCFSSFFQVILDILGLAHQYGFVELEAAVSDYLKEILNIKNVCIIFDAARLYRLEFLMKVLAFHKRYMRARSRVCACVRAYNFYL